MVNSDLFNKSIIVYVKYSIEKKMNTRQKNLSMSFISILVFFKILQPLCIHAFPKTYITAKLTFVLMNMTKQCFKIFIILAYHFVKKLMY